MRTLFFLISGSIINVCFGIIYLVIGIYYQSAWFISLSAYYALLVFMRLNCFLSKKEQTLYFQNSILMFLMIIVFSGFVVLISKDIGGKTYPGFTIYAIALYTFVRVGLSIRQLFVANKQHSYTLMMIRKIGYLDSCVSLLMLQSAMLTTFGEKRPSDFTHMMNIATGTVIAMIIFGFAIQSMFSYHRIKKSYR